MSNYRRAAYHPKEKVVRAADHLDNHFGPYDYGVRFPGDPHVYRPRETEIPINIVFVPAPARKEE